MTGRDLAPPAILGIADVQELGFSGLFADSRPVELEVGMGRADFLLTYAPANPGCNLVGVERQLVIARRAANKLAAAKIANVRVLQVEISHLLEVRVPPSSLRAVHIYFPDPWPKKRHAKRRFFSRPNMALLQRALQPEGFLHFRTDHEPYYEQVAELMPQFPQFVAVAVPAELLVHQTGYERKFTRHGLPIYRASYRLAKSVD